MGTGASGIRPVAPRHIDASVHTGTVNFDEPNTYQFYYGDTLGAPGTLLTFLCWPTAQRGSRGTGQVISLSFSVPEGALSYWAEYITLNGITVGGPNPRFVDQILSFFDPDGLQIDLVAHRGAEERSGWNNGPIPPEYAIRGLHSVSREYTGCSQSSHGSWRNYRHRHCSSPRLAYTRKCTATLLAL
jgi:glyoxalase family protein